MSRQVAADFLEDFVDFYDILQVSPSATTQEIVQGLNSRLAELANPDSELTLSARAEAINLVNLAFEVLTDFKSRFQYDIIHMMNLGELKLAPPRQDLPSREFARLRFMLVLRALTKTLNALAEAFTAADEEFIHVDCRGTNIDASQRLQNVLDKMWIFCAHVTLQIDACVDALDDIDDMSNDTWAYGIRDPRVHADTKQVCLARRTLRTLQTVERHINKHFWPQIAEALRIKDDDDMSAYPKRLLKILNHVRY